jgi:hypothetical protein
MGTPSIGTLGKLAIDVSTVTGISDFDGSSTQLEFLSEELRYTEVQAYNNGIRGTRSRVAERVRIAQGAVSGSIVLHPTPVELDVLFPLILGGAEVADSFTLAETIPEFGVLVERVNRRFVYTGCRVSRATFSGTQGQPITLRLDIEGETEIVSATAWPGTIPAINSGSPYIFADTTFSLAADASAAEVRSFEIVIDNGLITDRYMNSVNRQTIPSGDRVVSLSMSVPYTPDEVDLHKQALAGGSGSITLTNGSTSTVFTFGNLKTDPAVSPVIGSRGSEILLGLQMKAYRTGSTLELAVTHDST